MSWSRSFASLEDFMHDKGQPEAPTEQGAFEQYIIARQVAEKIIASRVLGGNGSLSNAETVEGTNDRDFHVYLGGHANPEHASRKGWSNDMLTVTVSQK